MSASAKAKLSAALKGHHHPHRGHPVSASTKAKISAALKGRHHAAHQARRVGVRRKPKKVT